MNIRKRYRWLCYIIGHDNVILHDAAGEFKFCERCRYLPPSVSAQRFVEAVLITTREWLDPVPASQSTIECYDKLQQLQQFDGQTES